MNECYANNGLTKTHGYVDFIIQGDKLPTTYDITVLFPPVFRDEYISTTPGIPLSNGKYVYYCRAHINIVVQLIESSSFRDLFLADSWDMLFEMDFPFWADVFDVQTNRKDTYGNVNYWRGKFSNLTKDDEIIRAFIPCAFAGDIIPDLELKDWHLKNFQLNSNLPPNELDITIASVNKELVSYLNKNPKKLYDLRPRQFEELICEVLKSFGWDVELTKATRDGGYDIFAISKDIAGVSSSWIIECKKHAPERKVGIEYVRSLCGVKNDKKVANAMIATTSFFTSGVLKAKQSRYDLELKDYDGIVEWLNVSYKKDQASGLLLPS